MPKRQRGIATFSLLFLIAGIGLFIGCSDDDPLDVQTVDYTNSLVIHTDPDFLSIPWSLTMPDGRTIAGKGDTLLNNISDGDYALSWVPLEGWTLPRPNYLSKELGSVYQIDFLGYYFLKPGSLYINPEPSTIDAGWILEGPEVLEGSERFVLTGSGDTTVSNLAPGDYTLTWEDIEGWQIQSESNEITLGIFGGIVEGIYELNSKSIYINPEPNVIDPPWTLSSENGLNQSGAGDKVLTNAWPDDLADTVSELIYTLTWGQVENWVAPDSETLSLGKGKSLQFSGNYTPGTGSAVIESEPAEVEAPWVLIGPNGISRKGHGGTSFTGLALGDYSLTWGDELTWKTPDPQTGTLSNSGNLSFSGTYLPSLIVDPKPDGFAAPWKIVGGDGFSEEGIGAEIFDNPGAGSYTITWLDISGWATPAAETVDFGNQGLVVSGEYTQNALTIFVRPEPQDITVPAEWILRGPDGFSESGIGQATITAPAVGHYTLVWEDVDAWSAPATTTLSLAENGNLTFRASYLPATSFVSIPLPRDDGGDYVGFEMGTSGEDCASTDEVEHHVELTNAFLMQSTEVTNGQFAAVLQWAVDNGHAVVNGTRVYDTLDGSSMLLLNLEEPELQINFANGIFEAVLPDHPMVEVSWYAAVSYCDWLSLHQGLRRSYDHSSWMCNSFSPYTATGYRLPTESEWEYACRAGSETAYSNTDIGTHWQYGCFVIDPELLDQICWHSGNSGSIPHEVASRVPNDFGLFDMHGNVLEWCNDWYRSQYCGAVCPSTNPVGPSTGSKRVLRGGSFFSFFDNCRSGARAELEPNSTSSFTGFRIVITD